MTITRLPIIIVGGSGSGKTTIAAELHDRGYRIAQITTTRKPRRVTADDRNFKFVTATEFDAMTKGDQFQFSDELFGAKYGIERNEVQAGEVFIAPVWRGAELRMAFRMSVCIHMLTPESTIVRERLSKRESPSTPTEIEQRVLDGLSQNETSPVGFQRIEPIPHSELGAFIADLQRRSEMRCPHPV